MLCTICYSADCQICTLFGNKDDYDYDSILQYYMVFHMVFIKILCT